jgi:tetratricopeptide (TPR) repeat protein
MTARVLLGYGNLERQRGNLVGARKMFEEALAITRQTEDQTILANLLNSYGNALRLEGDSKLARAEFEESLRIARAAGNRNAVSEALSSIATLDASLGNLAAARAGLDESVALKRQLGNQNSLAVSLSQLAAVLRMQGDLSAARKTVEEQCSIREALKEKRQLASCRIDLAELSIETAKPSEIRATLGRILAEPGWVPSGPAVLNKIARLWIAAGDLKKARETIPKTAPHIPENAIALTITAAQIDAGEGRSKQAIELLTRAQAEAAKFSYVPLVLEARLALAESGSHGQLLDLAAEAQRSGFALIAAKARALSAKTAS